MYRVILLTFGFMGWAWYEMSGGAEFEPGENGVTLVAAVDTQPLPAATTQVAKAQTASDIDKIDVTRADTTGAALTDVTPLDDLVEPVKTSFVTVLPTITVTQPKAALSNASLRTDSGPLVTPAVVNEASSIDIRAVTGSRVNLRDGPSTNYGVVTQLLRGEEVEVLTDDGSGWVELRALDGDNVGWMSASFLASVN